MRIPPYTLKSASVVALVFAVSVTVLHMGELALGYGRPVAHQPPGGAAPALAVAEPGDAGQD